MRSHLPCPEAIQSGSGEVREQEEIDSGIFNLVETYHDGLGRLYDFVPRQDQFRDLVNLFEFMEQELFNLLEQSIRVLGGIQVQIIIVANMLDQHTGLHYQIQPGTTLCRITHKKFIRDVLCGQISYLQEKIVLYNENGSNLTLDQIERLEIKVVKYAGFKGGRYIATPPCLKYKRGLLNIRTDTECFQHCIVASKCFNQALELAWGKRILQGEQIPKSSVRNTMENNPEYFKPFFAQFNFSGLDETVSPEDIQAWESEAEISVNLFGLSLRENRIIPIRTTRRMFAHHVNLLVLEEAEQSHFVLIISLGKFVCNGRTSSHIYCRFCLKQYHQQPALDRHEQVCQLNEDANRYPEINEDEEPNFVQFCSPQQTIPYNEVIFFDFESYLVPLKPTQGQNEVLRCRHEAMGFAIMLVSRTEGLLAHYSYYGENAVDKFLDKALEYQTMVLDSGEPDYPILMTDADWQRHSAAERCEQCGNRFTIANRKCRHHNHKLGKRHGESNYLGAFCNRCNLMARVSRRVPIIAHNSSKYDSYFVLQATRKPMIRRVQILPKNSNVFIGFYIDKLKFCDSVRWLPNSLRKLAKDLRKESRDKFKFTIQYLKETYHAPDENIDLLLGKQVFPYEWMTGPEVLQERQLPPIECFYDGLNGKPLKPEKYAHALQVYEKFRCETFLDYVRLYNYLDVLILADVFEHFRNEAIAETGLCPLHNWSSPGFAYASALHDSKVRIECLRDKRAIEMFKNSLYGGPTFLVERIVKANHEILENFNPKKPRELILYSDLNALYR